MSKKLSKIDRMIEVLEGSLSRSEMAALFVMIDNDPPGGPFYCALGNWVEKRFCQNYSETVKKPNLNLFLTDKRR